MRVIHCPSCGSDSVNKSSSSFEYGGSTRWSCEDCSWYYKKGRGIGTGTGNSGTHPRKAGPSGGQATLTQTGSYCKNCDTCVAGEHGCRADYHVGGGETVSQDEVAEALEEWHYSGVDQLTEDIEAGRVHLEPNMYAVVLPGDTDEFDALLLDAVRNAIGESSNTFVRDNEASIRMIHKNMGADTSPEKAFIGERLNDLWRNGPLLKSKSGWRFRDNE